MQAKWRETAPIQAMDMPVPASPDSPKEAEPHQPTQAAADAEVCRREGIRLFRSRKYEAAASKYTVGLSERPDDYRLWSGRAACRAALKDWARCWQDALHATQLRPDAVKGWLLLAKALWREDMPVVAKHTLMEALRCHPGNPELLALNSEIDRHCPGGRSRGASAHSRISALKMDASTAALDRVSSPGSTTSTTPPGSSRSRSCSRSSCASVSTRTPSPGSLKLPPAPHNPWRPGSSAGVASASSASSRPQSASSCRPPRSGAATPLPAVPVRPRAADAEAAAHGALAGLRQRSVSLKRLG